MKDLKRQFNQRSHKKLMDSFKQTNLKKKFTDEEINQFKEE